MRMIASATIALVANAIALIVASVVLGDRMELYASGFITAVLVYTGVDIFFTPFIRQQALKKAQVLMGSTALVSTFVSLLVARVVTDGLRINGVTSWVLAVLAVWLIGLVARLIAPLVIFKKTMAAVKDGSPAA